MLVSDVLSPSPLGSWRFSGFLGQRIDAVLTARLLEAGNRERIHAETVDAFRKRVDDRMNPNSGLWQGEFWGKYILSAIAACAYTGDRDLEAFVADSTRQLIATQREDGYIGTYDESGFVCLRPGGTNWNVWCRKYTLWGLIEAWELTGNDDALKAACGMLDHLMTEVGPDAPTDICRTGTFNGLASTSILTPVIKLYGHTARQRYLDYALYIVDQWGKHPDGPPDIFRKGLTNIPVHTWFPNSGGWAKSYEFVSCLEGLLELYRVTGEEDYLRCVKNVHAMLAQWERAPIGSISFNDKFVGANRLINLLSEVCDAVYWNRLSLQLLRLTGDPAYADEIERTLLNTLVPGANPDGTWALRRLRSSHEHVPAPQHCKLEHHQCCVNNLPRGLIQAAEAALMQRNGGVAVLLYSPGKGKVELPTGQTIQVQIDGDSARSGHVTVTLNPDCQTAFPLALRIPQWSAVTSLSTGGKCRKLAVPPDGWHVIERVWGPGDTVELQFDMRARMSTFDPSLIAGDEKLIGWANGQWANLKNMLPNAPPHSVTLADAIPQGPAVLVERGPLVLASDARVPGTPTVPHPLPEMPDQPPTLEAIPPPSGIAQAYIAHFEGIDSPIPLCDFPSAGNTWDQRTSRFSMWLPVNSSAST
ncbi:MAG: hypothetical protein HN742_01145 [Lentisphaerae bacterium]|jgi:uncharacterized protein|nr:hypothetical protein [Lentisphaerota bacterium]MBT4819687.1 hypothetical protein [Lentisphaerota bacterium]MBT5605954.1 hypothetical protein [Lentisphaerota bacterium]MBT7058828.1 hypothetical protein [Lentisphaerota bacterium]MBT7840439.1 hypothetical protein [Lentisphaerota bacterium]